MRKISDKFMKDLKVGELKPILDMVKRDDSLCLEIRENAINVYYRGGNILKVTESDGKYFFSFDENYAIENNGMWKTFSLDNIKLNPTSFVENLPFMKREMDNYLIAHPKNEREFQQVILRENNSTKLAGDTDYYIADIENAEQKINNSEVSRFDMIAVHWASTSGARKSGKNIGVCIIEVKYGDNAIDGKAGIVNHIEKLNKSLSSESFLTKFYEESESQFNQKLELGLIEGTSKKIKIDRTKKLTYILAFANHKPVKSKLKKSLDEAQSKYPSFFEKVDVKIARSSLMGYGLYDSEFITVDQFLSESE